jgi:hypothetical protein
MSAPEQNRRLTAEIVGIWSAFSFLTVHFYADGPSGPLTGSFYKTKHGTRERYEPLQTDS